MRRGLVLSFAVVCSFVAVGGGSPAAAQQLNGTGSGSARPAPSPVAAAASPALLGAAGPGEQALPAAGLAGAAAVRALGVDLVEVASENRMRSSELFQRLLADPGLRVDGADQLFYVEPVGAAHDEHEHELEHDHAGDAAAAAAEPVAASWSRGGADPFAVDAFALHSRPASTLKIYLDFNGHTTTGTYWNNSYGSTIVSAPLDQDGSPSTFNASEKATIAEVWSGVAEDFAPWDVDVTTEDPGVEALRRTSVSDTSYGIRVVVTPSSFLSAGGVAYLNSFSWDSDTPAFVFLAASTAKNMIEAASHEVGHTFGLNHDGTGSTAYYSGQGSWAPIMGVGYYKTVSQWSKGEYTGANNLEDDVAKIGTYVPVIADDHADTQGSSSPVTVGTAVTGRIGSQSDVDWFRFTTGGGAFTVNVQPAWYANLDISVQLYSSSSLLATVDQTTLGVLYNSGDLAAGTYWVRVDGVGSGTAASTGYSDYASVGEYLFAVEGASGPTDPDPVVTVAASASSVAVGTPVTFTASSLTHPGLTGLTVQWAFSDGSTYPGGTSVTRTPSTVGSFTASVTVTNSLGVSAATSVVVTVASANQAPVASATASATSVTVGSSVSFSASGSRDPEGKTLTYAWAFSDGSVATGVSVTKSFSVAGSVTATVTARDPEGLTGTASVAVTVVANRAPVVSATASKSTVVAGTSVSFTASATDPDGDTVTYLWTFPDASTSTARIVSKTPVTEGSFVASVTARDSRGATTTATVTVTVTANTAPTVTATVSPSTAASPATFTFAATGTDVNGQTLTYAWKFSDGTSSTAKSVTKKWTAAGVYTGTVTVKDTAGATASATVTATVTSNKAPKVTLSASALTLAAPGSFTFTAAGSDPDGQLLTYSWKFSDGTSSTSKSVVKKWSTLNSYTATVTVKDPGGLTGSASVTVTVTANTAPTVAAAASSLTVAPGAAVTFSAAASDPDGQALTYLWRFSDGTSSTAKSVTKKWNAAGVYTATVTVKDPGGLTASSTVTVTVSSTTSPSPARAVFGRVPTHGRS